MDDYCDTAILTLVLVLAACLTVFILKVGAPSGAIFALLFPRV